MFRSLLKSAGCVVLCAAAVSAQTPSGISPEKTALIKDLLEVTNAKNNAVTAFTALLDQNEKSMPEIIWQAITQTAELRNLSAHEQEEVRKIANESSKRVAQRMRKMLFERLDFGAIIDQVYYPLFDKYFTTDELTEIDNFYKTPVGKKSLTLFPNIYSEAVAKTGDIISPQVTDIMKEIMKTEQPTIDAGVARLIKERKSATPARPKSTSSASQRKP